MGWIKNRIDAEFRKHYPSMFRKKYKPNLDWSLMAEKKILAQLKEENADSTLCEKGNIISFLRKINHFNANVNDSVDLHDFKKELRRKLNSKITNLLRDDVNEQGANNG